MRLPGVAQEIADVIGRERALYLIGQLPRCTQRDPRYPNAQRDKTIMYVPSESRLKPDHTLVQILGWNDAVKLCRHFGGEILQPPNCSEVYRRWRDVSIINLVMQGVSAKTVAQWFEVTERHVKNITREIPPEEKRAANDNNRAVRNTGKSA